MNSRRIAFVLCCFAMASSLALVVFSRPAAGDTTDTLSSWIDAQPSITKVADIAAAEYNQQLPHTNFPCTQKELYTWGHGTSLGAPRSEYTQAGCFVPMANGDMSGDRIVPYGARQAQQLVPDSLTRVSFFPARNSNKIALVSNSYAYFYGGTPTLHLVDDWAQTFNNFQLDSYANVIRHSSANYHTFTNADGSPIDIRSNGIAFSANGEWLHAVATNRAQLLINTSTREIIPYTSYINSGDFAEDVAVSNDGRYVAITIPYQGLRLFDLKRCDPATGELQSRNCQSRSDIYDQLKNYVGTDDLRIFQMEFMGANNNLDVSAAVHNAADGTWSYGKYRLSIPNTQPSKYLALGDSFSSGEGSYDYRSPTDFYVDESNYNVCHQSKNSYPYLIQESQNFEWFNSIACSGAQARDLSFQDSLEYLRGYPQARTLQKNSGQVGNALENFIPGYVPQMKFSDLHHPTVATVSVGGNDFGFGKIIEKCVLGGGDNDILCYFNRDEREKLANSIEDKIPELTTLFSRLKTSLSGSDPRLYVVGYPEIISPNGFCGLNVAMQPTETEFTVHLTHFINQAIEAAARKAGARYVDVSKAFVDGSKDYRLCGNTEQYAVNGLVFKSKTSKKPDRIAYSESYHPNQLGQSLLAAAVLRATSNLTSRLLEVDSSAIIPESSRIELVGDTEIRYPNYDIRLVEDVSPDTMFRGDQLDVNLRLDSKDGRLPVDSDIRAEIHSDPVVLGNLQLLGDTISGTVVIPDTIEAGYHELHIVYNDIQGNTVDMYKHLYVANSKSDLDGDGIGNNFDPCYATIQGGVDKDDDGIDDSCDGEYVRPSTVANNDATKATNGKSTPNYTQESSVYLSSNKENDIFSIPDAAFQSQAKSKNAYGDNESSSNLKQSQKKQENNSMIILSVIAAVAILSTVTGVLLKNNG